MLLSTCLIFGFATMVESTPRFVKVVNRGGFLSVPRRGEAGSRIISERAGPTLDLKNNGLFNIEPGLLPGMVWIETSDVSKNQFTSIRIFALLPSSSKTIVAKNNIIQALSVVDLRSIPHLSSIYLDGNQITRLTGAKLRNVPNLHTLSLSGNQIVDVFPSFFATLGSVRRLILKSNRIATLRSNVFTNLINIVYISLEDNDLRVVAYDIFGQLIPRSLKTFDVHLNLLKTVSNQVSILGRGFYANPNEPLEISSGRIVLDQNHGGFKVLY